MYKHAGNRECAIYYTCLICHARENLPQMYTSRQDCSLLDRARENAIYKVMETNERN